MQPIRRHLLITACLFLLAGIAQAQRMPQDSWYFSHKWWRSGTGDGQFNKPSGVTVAPDSRVIVADTGNNRIQVFEADGTFVRKWGSTGTLDGQFNKPSGVTLASDRRVIVADTGNHRIQVFEADGTFVRKWGSYGTGDGQLSSPYGIAVSPDGRVLVADTDNNRIQVFEADGTFVRKWGTRGTLDGQFGNPRGITVSHDGRVLVADTTYNGRIQVFEPDGVFMSKWFTAQYPRSMAVAPDGNILVSYGLELNGSPSHVRIYGIDGTYILQWGTYGSGDGQFYQPLGIAVAPDGSVIIADYVNSRIQVFRQAGYRLAPQFGDIPLPLLKNVAQRPGTPYLDVDYVVWDGDSTNVTVAVAALEDGVDSLNNFIKISSFVDGTESAIGSNVLANVTNRFTWNVAADWQADYVNLKVRMMAQDERGLMSVGFVTLPEDVTNSLPALTISQTPITHSDMLPLWYWLLATGDPSVVLSSGSVFGVGGSYNGIKLAQATTTTTDGRTFLFSRLGVRAATTGEVTRAKTGSAGVVNQWTPRITVGPDDRPKKLNEFGFDTGDWGTNGWWVVKE